MPTDSALQPKVVVKKHHCDVLHFQFRKTPMDEELRQKVRHDLEKSGFCSEMNVIRCFSQNNWTCEGSGAYFDRDECKTREIDAIGCHHLRQEVSEGLYAAAWFHVVAQVKRSDKPWVVFRQPLSRSPLPPMDAWNNLAHCAGPTWLRVQLAEAISGHSLLCDLGWRGYSVHESFKPPDKPVDQFVPGLAHWNQWRLSPISERWEPASGTPVRPR